MVESGKNKDFPVNLLIVMIWLIFVFLFDLIFLQILPRPLFEIFSKGTYPAGLTIDPQALIILYFFLPILTGFLFQFYKGINPFAVGLIAVAPLLFRIEYEVLLSKMYGMGNMQVLLNMFIAKNEIDFSDITHSVFLPLIILSFLAGFMIHKVKQERWKSLQSPET